jgi:enoyl-CoA hydratase/carnithine racemase
MANDIVALRKDGPVATVTLQRSPANAISDEVALEATRVHCAS